MNYFNLRIALLFTILILQFPVFAQTSKKTVKAPYYSEEHARGCLEDYFDFYNADESYSDPKFRRISNNVFYVSLKTCMGGEDVCYTKENLGTWDKPLYINKPREFFWHSKVLVLTITSKTKYTIKEKQKPLY